jgi:hypothetical protein
MRISNREKYVRRLQRKLGRSYYVWCSGYVVGVTPRIPLPASAVRLYLARCKGDGGWLLSVMGRGGREIVNPTPLTLDAGLKMINLHN